MLHADKSTKVEFHCHTSFSHDCKIDFNDRLTFFERENYTHLAITDHDRVLPRKLLMSEEYLKSKVSVICGIEVSTFVGHIVLYNCKIKPLFNALWFLVLWSKILDCEISVPHPCRKGTGLFDVFPKRGFREKYILWFLKYVKYLEVYNYRDKVDEYVFLPEVIIEECKLKKFIIASDSHFENDINKIGCSLNGLPASNLLVIDFFSKKVLIGDVIHKPSFDNFLVNLKWNVRYLLKGF